MNFTFFLLVFVALTFNIYAETHDIHGRIYNGQDAENRKYRFMAYLVPEKQHCCGLIKDINICAGAIIAPNWVLTAAHCVHGKVRATVYLGITVTEVASIAYKVLESSIFIHQQYNKEKMYNDIALIQIPKTVECDNIVYAQLTFSSASSTEMFADKIAFILGWGVKGNSGAFADHLQKAKVKVMSTQECQSIIPRRTDVEICVKTGKPFGSICWGDSGGPLVLEESGELIGVASFITTDSCENGLPAVFMRVTSYLPWIIDVVGRIN